MAGIRQPCAQNFYPGNCQENVERFIENFSLPSGFPGTLNAAILPHAGWVYSGAVAARTLFTLSQCSNPELCIVFGTDHTGVPRHAVYPDGAWATPLGTLKINAEIAAGIASSMPEKVQLSRKAHAQEHSIEVLTPMIRYFWPHIQMVPIIVKPESSALELGKTALDQVVNYGKAAVFIASSDLTHYGRMYGNISMGLGIGGLAWMEGNDRRMIRRLCALETGQILSEARYHQNACGPGALVALLSILVDISKTQGNLVQYATSHGKQPGDEFTGGVGYAGIVY